MPSFRGAVVPEAMVRRATNAETSALASAILGGIVAAIIVVAALILIRRLYVIRQRGKYHHANAASQSQMVLENGLQPRSPSQTQPPIEQTVQTQHTPQVDRILSVRSVMTLPAYRKSVGHGEQVLGREGERDGIDVVVEMPTAEEEEALRDEEMETLYQIRLARRRQIEEQEQRRAQRREAREQNDSVALREVRQRMREAAATNPIEIEQLRVEHQQLREYRQRAVSSVAYAAVGIARADGTRVRGNSVDSERQGLLSDAASIALSTPSMRSGGGLHAQGRDRSHSSATSTVSGRPDSPLSPGFVRSHASPVVGSPWPTPRVGTSPEMMHREEVDLGDATMPPGYDHGSPEDLTPVHSRTGSTSAQAMPYREPPPGYPGLAAAHLTGETRDAPRRSGAPKLPRLQRMSTLRMDSVPKIVVQPSSARPQDEEG